MKVKTIKKIITQKMNEWLVTLPEKLREEVKSNIVVSGGCITSMLLREDVNDYDIYIQNINTLKKLAKYYTIDVLDGRLRDQYLKDLFPFVDSDGNYNPTDITGDDGYSVGEPYLSENYVRIANLQSDQIKLNIPSVGKRFEVEEKDAEGNNNYLVTFLSQNAISLSNGIQIVLRFSGTVEQIHRTFDFMHATNYFTFKEGVVFNQEALLSIMTKDLKYQGSLYPVTSIIRAKKFTNRGWTISAGEMLKIMFQISELNLYDLRVLEEQLIGVDVAYFGLLIDALRVVPKEKLNRNYISELIDKIFNEYDGEENFKPIE